jgi:hypothetical protein
MKKNVLSVLVDDKVVFSKEIDSDGDWLDMQTQTIKLDGVVEFPPYDWRVVVIMCHSDRPRRMLGEFFYYGDPLKMVDEMKSRPEAVVDWGEGERDCIFKSAKIVEDRKIVYIEIEEKTKHDKSTHY